MSLTDLAVHIDKNEPKEFIHLYLKCLVEQYQLITPLDLDIADLNKSWEEILAKFRGSFSDEFCNDVANYWLSLLKKCDLNSIYIEMDLYKSAGLDTNNIENRELTAKHKRNTTEFDMSKKVPTTGDMLIKPHLSDRYQQRKIAESTRLPEVAKLKSVYTKTFKAKKAQEWLVCHLTFAKYGQDKPVPKSSVPATIREQWESIILKEFDTIADEGFVMELTNDWFYLVNQKGIPTNTQHIEELLIIFLAKIQKPTKKVKPKKDSFFKKLFN